VDSRLPKAETEEVTSKKKRVGGLKLNYLIYEWHKV